MEVHAHDPLRYLGDMLAWVHQSLASERDLFVALFGTDPASAEVGDPAAAGCTPLPSAVAWPEPAEADNLVHARSCLYVCPCVEPRFPFGSTASGSKVCLSNQCCSWCWGSVRLGHAARLPLLTSLCIATHVQPAW